MPDPFYSKRPLTRFLLAGSFVLSTLLSALYLAYPSFISATDHRTTDLIMARGGHHPPTGRVVIVDIDEASLARYGQWPWPRIQLARLLDSIDAAGAAAVALDMILAEPDRTSPENLRSDQLLAADRTELQDHDGILAATLSRGPFVLGYQFLFGSGAPHSPPCTPHQPGVVLISGPGAAKEPPPFHEAQGAVCNRQIFSDSVSRSGFLNATPDADGILRRVPLLIGYRGHLYPSLQLATVMQYDRSSQLEIMRRGARDTLSLSTGKRRLAVDGHGNMLVSFSLGPRETPRISAGELLGGGVARERLGGRIVVVGSSAAGLEPTYQTPAGTIRSHVEIHAQVLENLLRGEQAMRTRDLLVWEVLLGLVVAAGTALAVAFTGILPSSALSGAMVAAVWAGSVAVFRHGGYLFSPLLPTVLALANLAALTITKGWRAERIARRVADDATALAQASEKKLNVIVAAVPDIIFSLDRQLRIVFVSHAVERYAAPPIRLIGRSILPFLRKGDRAHFRTLAEGVCRGLPGTLELQWVRLKRRGVWFSTHLVPLREDGGEIAGILGVARDVTERRSVERALEEKTRLLETLNLNLEERIAEAVQESRRKDQILIYQGRQAAMGEMISNIAHQWRQPLNTLGLVVQELTITYDTGRFSRETLHEGVRRAMRLIMHMSSTIEDFRNYFKVEKSKATFRATDAVLRALSLIEPTLKALGIEVEIRAVDDCEIEGFPNEYSQVLLNILLNSRDAFLSRPEIEKRAMRITIFREQGRSVVTIADNAGGMAEGIVHKVFDPYFTTKGPEQGTGIGLYMAKMMIEKNMGGRISARNVDGGAEFRIEV